MPSIATNPFQELYFTESIDPDRFIELFSPLLVNQAPALFQPGHVILKGLPGTGKSMLLSLFKPEVRLAYAQKKGAEFPVPHQMARFVGAGINMRRSGISDFSQRPVRDAHGALISPYLFADFLNYFLVQDLFNSLDQLSGNLTLSKDIGLEWNSDKQNELIACVCKNDCWSGYFDDVRTYPELLRKMQLRIREYRNYLNFNRDTLSESLMGSKSILGEPISVVVHHLRKIQALENGTEVYIRLDQYEDLPWMETEFGVRSTPFQELVHKLLGSRDTVVSYRIGTRHFAWPNDPKMFATSARLEGMRNLTDISIDALLKRKENRKTWIFPSFVDDILTRRLNHSLGSSDSKWTLDTVFGAAPDPTEKARGYFQSGESKAIRVETDWPQGWIEFLKALAKKDPLSARLGEAWVRQADEKKKDYMYSVEFKEPYPWEKVWWKKERIEQALLQLASRNNQNLRWYGRNDVLNLSGSNILAFLILCKHVWAVALRDQQMRNDYDGFEFPFGAEVQTLGIREASDYWYESISIEKYGMERRELVTYLGTFFHKRLTGDLAMSYPGHNGFSLLNDEFETDSEVVDVLKQALAYGDLYDAPHTSKSADKRKRTKFYLCQILSPFFRIPVSHPKEPIYVSLDDIATWVREASRGDDDASISKKRKKGNEQGRIDFPSA